MTESSNTGNTTLELSAAERRTLRGFYRRHKYRWWYYLVLLFIMIYCLTMVPVCAYFALSVFTGDSDADQITRKLPADTEMISRRLQPVKAFFDKINFLGIAWTTVLHGTLLLYIGFRLFRRIMRASTRAPQASLTVKLASRLVELGELDPVD